MSFILLVWLDILSKITIIDKLFEKKVFLNPKFNLNFNTFVDGAKVLACIMNISEHFPEKCLRRKKLMFQNTRL